jgi:hypothetical protein
MNDRVVNEKLDTLTSANTTLIRFMNHDELLHIFSNGSFKGEAKLLEMAYCDFIKTIPKKNISEYWGRFIEKTLDWRYAGYTAENYKVLESTYIEQLRNEKTKEKALIKFRLELLRYLAQEKKESRCKTLLLKAYQSNDLTSRGEFGETFIEKTKDIVLGLCADPEYLVKNQENIRQIMLDLSPGRSIILDADSFTETELYKRYHIACFLNQNTIKGVVRAFKGDWLIAEGNASELLGILVLVPSRDFRNLIKKEMLAAAGKIPQMACPLFKDNGDLFYP